MGPKLIDYLCAIFSLTFSANAIIALLEISSTRFSEWNHKLVLRVLPLVSFGLEIQRPLNVRNFPSWKHCWENEKKIENCPKHTQILFVVLFYIYAKNFEKPLENFPSFGNFMISWNFPPISQNFNKKTKNIKICYLFEIFLKNLSSCRDFSWDLSTTTRDGYAASTSESRYLFDLAPQRT